MIVVADAGPLIYLDGIGKLDLLPALYGRVLVPRRVFEVNSRTRGGVRAAFARAQNTSPEAPVAPALPLEVPPLPPAP